jgi:uncharacterized iron-regulated membrane protein
MSHWWQVVGFVLLCLATIGVLAAFILIWWNAPDEARRRAERRERERWDR